MPFNDDYASKGHQYFDVWAPEMATHYGEVFWTDQHDQPLPADIVAKFKGKVIALTGYEQDQVMVTPTGQPGVNPDKDVSVPINWAYNHHYMAWMTGSLFARDGRNPSRNNQNIDTMATNRVDSTSTRLATTSSGM